MTFVREGDDLRVRLSMAAQVDFGFITVFRYRHDSDEVWRGGRLVAAEAYTDDDGEERWVTGIAKAEGFVVDGPAGRLVAPANVLPSSYWHPDTMRQSQLLDLSKGKLREITVSKLADEALDIAGQSVIARQFELTGQMKAKLWYDDSGTWLKTTLKKKGSDVHLVLESAPVLAAAELEPALTGRVAEGSRLRQFAAVGGSD